MNYGALGNVILFGYKIILENCNKHPLGFEGDINFVELDMSCIYIFDFDNPQVLNLFGYTL